MPTTKAKQQKKTSPKRVEPTVAPKSGRIDYKRKFNEMAESEKLWRGRAKDYFEQLKQVNKASSQDDLNAYMYRETHKLHNLVSMALCFAVVALFIMWAFK